MAKTITGIVVSDKADKTIVVAVHSRQTHPIYKKQYSMTKKFIAHDANNEAKVGDKVDIQECRPVSRRKRFALAKIVEAARILHVEPEETIKKADKEEAEDKE
jgi:small subunit ribosomal protein S17